MRLYTNSLAKVPAARKVVIQPQNVRLDDQRIVSMPRWRALRSAAYPGGARMASCRSTSTAGSAARAAASSPPAMPPNYPIKHGGLGAQMADAAAAAIAVLAGARRRPPLSTRSFTESS